jgi:hypothetical protein
VEGGSLCPCSPYPKAQRLALLTCVHGGVPGVLPCLGQRPVVEHHVTPHVLPGLALRHVLSDGVEGFFGGDLDRGGMDEQQTRVSVQWMRGAMKQDSIVGSSRGKHAGSREMHVSSSRGSILMLGKWTHLHLPAGPLGDLADEVHGACESHKKPVPLNQTLALFFLRSGKAWRDTHHHRWRGGCRARG